MTHFARMKERQFAEYINQKNSLELWREIDRVQKELNAMRRRNGELSALFKRLYEDNALGHVTNEQFRMLSAGYNAEQKELESAIPAKEEQLKRLKASVANVDAFIKKAKQYTAIDHLTPELLRLFIQRIEVGERTKSIPAPHTRASGSYTGTSVHWTVRCKREKLRRAWRRRLQVKKNSSGCWHKRHRGGRKPALPSTN